MTSNIISAVFYLMFQNGFTSYKAYDNTTYKQRQADKFCTVSPKETREISRAAKSDGSIVVGYETDVEVSLYFGEKISINEIYTTCDEIIKTITGYQAINVKSVFLKDIAYSASHRMITRDVIITITYIEEEK